MLVQSDAVIDSHGHHANLYVLKATVVDGYAKRTYLYQKHKHNMELCRISPLLERAHSAWYTLLSVHAFGGHNNAL